MVVSAIALATGGGIAATPPGQDAAVADDEVTPKPVTTNASSDEYRGYEPTQDELDKPVDLDTAPDEFTAAASGSDAAGTASSSSSIVWDDNDTDPALVGETKQYLASDIGSYYFKDYSLVALGDEVEVWVATNLSWPVDDPRADPTITEEQAETLAREFDEEMYPVESEVFGEPAPRNGTESLLEQQGIVPEDYYETGNGSDRTVLLVDNVRDENYYDPTYPIFTAGFYSPTIQTYTDRNVITVDSYDWNDVEEPGDLTGYEDTVAHELQHLIHADLDGDETSWVNEGMSNYAEVVTGYGVSEGHLSAYEEMPSNSLINWEDQGAVNVLADYGVAFAWTMYLEDQFGQEFVSNLAADEANGIAGVENTLAETGADRDFYELFQDFSTAVVTDAYDRPPKDRFQFDNLEIDVNTSRDTGTAGVYGANYREIDTSDKGPITDVTVSGTDFVGTQWSTATGPVTGDGEVLYSGSGNLLNRFAVVETDLSDVEDPTLSFDSFQRIEENWDYGFVQVSTDGGETWESLANEHTDDSPNPSAHPLVQENLPGLTGDTDGWERQEFDLSAYEGEEDVRIAFRYVTDWATVEDGWWIRNVSVAGEDVATNTTEPYASLRETRGDYVEYQFSFVGIKHNGNYKVEQLDMRTFDDGDEQDLQQFLRNGNFEKVIVVSTWAGKSGESGRVPVGVEFEYAHENGGGPGNGHGNGNGGGPPGHSDGHPGNGNGPPGHSNGHPGNGR